MVLKFFLHFFLIVLSVTLQLSFISGLPFGLENFNLFLIAIIFVLMLSSFKASLWWAVGLGFFLDLYSFLPFGAYMVCLLAMVLFANFMAVNFFTDRSLYSFIALTFISTILFNLILLIFLYILGKFGGSNQLLANFQFFKDFVWQLILNLSAVFLLFYGISFVSRRLRPVFLERK